MRQVLASLVLVSVLQSTLAYFITVDAHDDECFMERVTKGTKLGLAFEVVEGGFLDIDLTIMAPNNEVLHSGERESNGRYTFPAAMDGVYKYCFSNKMSTMTPKIVMFTMDVGDGEAKKPVEKKEGEEATDTKLEEMISELSAGLLGVKHEQDYMEARERVHRAINESTNSRVVMWACFEAIVLLSMTLGQVYYLKQFFEVRRVV